MRSRGAAVWLHLYGVEQGNKDGLAAFVDHDQAERLDGRSRGMYREGVERRALAAIEATAVWWDAMLERSGWCGIRVIGQSGCNVPAVRRH